MNTSDQLPAATDELTLCFVFATQRRDFYCRRDLHNPSRAQVLLRYLPVASRQPTSRRPSRRDSSSLRDNYWFVPSIPHHEFEIKFNFEMTVSRMCLATALAISRAMEARPYIFSS